MSAVPFTFDELYAGFASCDGLLRNEGDRLCLEYQVKDALVGALKSGVKEVQLPLSDIAGIRLHRRWFGLSTTLVLQMRRMQPVDDVPGMKQGRLEIKVARRDRPFAEKLIAEVEKKLPRG